VMMTLIFLAKKTSTLIQWALFLGAAIGIIFFAFAVGAFFALYAYGMGWF